MQAPGYVVIRLEMIHEARIVPVDGRPALDPAIKQWMGESRGHWEGDTLVVETTNFNGQGGMTNVGIPGSPRGNTPTSTNMKITERFTRTADDTIDYSDDRRGSRRAHAAVDGRVPDAARPELPVLRVRLQRGQHRRAQLHRDVALRARPRRQGQAQ